MKRKFKGIALVALLAVAGLFSASAALINKRINDTPVVEEAKADSIPSVIYFTIITNWGGSWSNVLNERVTFDNYTSGGQERYKFTDHYGKGKDIISVIEDKSLVGSYPGVVAIDMKYNSNATTVYFDNGSHYSWESNSQTDTMDIPTDGRNLFVLNSDRENLRNQKGFWTYYNPTEPVYEASDTFYFVPNYKWSDPDERNDSKTGYMYCWPHLTFTYANGTITKYADGVTHTNPTWTDRDNARPFIFFFRNIPLVTPTLLKVTGGLNNKSEGSDEYISYVVDGNDATNNPLTDWYDSTTHTHSRNVYGVDKTGWLGEYSSPGYRGYYHSPDEESKAYLTGSFLMHENITWPSGSNPWPNEQSSFTKESSGVYTNTIFVTKGDMFKLYTYNYLSNKYQSSPGTSDWEINGLTGPIKYEESKVSIYDKNGVDITTKGESKSDYIQASDASENPACEFKVGGTIKFRRKITTNGDFTLELQYLDDSSSTYYIIGSGSFVSGDETWSTSTGIQLKADRDNKGVIANQHFDAGDAFKISNGSIEYGFGTLVGKGITATDFFHQAKYNLVTITGNTGTDEWETWTYELGNYSGVNGGSGEVNAVDASYSVYWKTNAAWENAKGDYQGVRANYGGDNNLYTTSETIDAVNHIYKSDVSVIDRSSLAGMNIYKHYNDANQTTQWISRASFYNGNIVVKKSGYYNIFLDNSGNVNVSLVSIDDYSFTSGQALYLEINDNWKSGNPAPFFAAHFWNDTGGDGNNINIQMTVVQGYFSGDYLLEVIIPTLTSGNPDHVILYRGPTGSFSPTSMDGTWNQTTTLDPSAGMNEFKLYDDSWDSGYWATFITDDVRADYYARYFNSLTDGSNGGICDANGDTHIDDYIVEGQTVKGLRSRWALLKTEYDKMCSGARTVVTNTVAKDTSESGYTNLQYAMGRYDYIVFNKQYSLLTNTDFAGRESLQTGRLYVNGGNNQIQYLTMGEDSFTTIIIIVTSSLSLLSITALSILLVKKRKRDIVD